MIGGSWWPLSSRCCLSPASTRWSITGECLSKKDTCHDEVAQWKRRSCRHDCAVHSSISAIASTRTKRRRSATREDPRRRRTDGRGRPSQTHCRHRSIVLPGNVVGWYEAPDARASLGTSRCGAKTTGTRSRPAISLAEINAPDLDAEYAQVRADLESGRPGIALPRSPRNAGWPCAPTTRSLNNPSPCRSKI